MVTGLAFSFRQQYFFVGGQVGCFYEVLSADGSPVVILEIQAASHTLVQFDGTEFIRVGSYKKKLREL